MGRKSSVSRLPADVKAYIEAMLATGAQTLDEMIADLLVGLTNVHKTWGFGLCFLHLRNVKGHVCAGSVARIA